MYDRSCYLFELEVLVAMVEIEAGVDRRPGLAALEVCDGEAVTRLFGRLSAVSVYRRFFSPAVKPEQLSATLARLDHHDSEAVAAIDGGEVIGVAQYSRAAGSPLADLAIVIADGWQRQGLGTRLVAALAERARAEGIEGFAVDIQGDNYAALKLLKRVAPEVRLAFSGGIGEGVIPLRPDER
jgi:GNAT superfamily N-acetyltransferase